MCRWVVVVTPVLVENSLKGRGICLISLDNVTDSSEGHFIMSKIENFKQTPPPNVMREACELSGLFT